MLCSLPRTFDFTPSGQAVPEDPDPKLIGQYVQLDRFASADTILKQRLDEEVSDPLEAWLTAFADVQVRLGMLPGRQAVIGIHSSTQAYLSNKSCVGHICPAVQVPGMERPKRCRGWLCCSLMTGCSQLPGVCMGPGEWRAQKESVNPLQDCVYGWNTCNMRERLE